MANEVVSKVKLRPENDLCRGSIPGRVWEDSLQACRRELKEDKVKNIILWSTEMLNYLFFWSLVE